MNKIKNDINLLALICLSFVIFVPEKSARAVEISENKKEVNSFLISEEENIIRSQLNESHLFTNEYYISQNWNESYEAFRQLSFGNGSFDDFWETIPSALSREFFSGADQLFQLPSVAEVSDGINFGLKLLNRAFNTSAQIAPESNINIIESIHPAIGNQATLLLLDKFEKKNPNFHGLYRMRCKVYASMDDYQKALNNCNIALSKNSNDTQSILQKAMVYVALGKNNEALATFNQAVNINKNYSTLISRAQFNLKIRNQNWEAIKDLNTIIENLNLPEDNRLLNSLYMRGIIHKNLGSYENAISDFEQVEKIDKNYLKVQFNLDKVYEALGRDRQQEKADIATAEKEQYLFDAIIKDRRGTSTISDFDKVINVIGSNTRVNKEDRRIDGIAYIYRGVLHHKNNSPKLAISDFNKAIEIYPERSDIYNRRGMSYINLHSHPTSIQALKDFNTAISLDTNNFEAYSNTGWLYLNHFKDYKKAENIFKELLEKIEDLQDKRYQAYIQFQVYQNLGSVYYEDGELNSAIDSHTKAIELMTTEEFSFLLDSQPYAERASYKMKKKKYDSALEDINLAIEINPNKPYHYLTKGTIYFQQNQDEEARVSFQQGLDVAQRIGDTASYNSIQDILSKVRW